MKHQDVLALITTERQRQQSLRRNGAIPFTCASIGVSNADKLVVLAEETGEVARAIQNSDLENLREELVQVAAVAVGWLEALA